MAVFFVPEDRRELVKHLTEAWEETMVWFCIQGHMGQVCADSIENPRSAQFVIGDFWFFAGKHRVRLSVWKEDDIPAGTPTTGLQ